MGLSMQIWVQDAAGSRTEKKKATLLHSLKSVQTAGCLIAPQVPVHASAMSSGETEWEAEPISCFLQEGNICAWDVQDLWHTVACNPRLSDWHTGMAWRNMGITLPDTTKCVREGES